MSEKNPSHYGGFAVLNGLAANNYITPYYPTGSAHVVLQNGTIWKSVPCDTI